MILFCFERMLDSLAICVCGLLFLLYYSNSQLGMCGNAGRKYNKNFLMYATGLIIEFYIFIISCPTFSSFCNTLSH